MKNDEDIPKRYGTCKSCGRKVWKKRLTRNKICLDCIGKKIQNNVKELTQKEGPGYEKYLAGLEAYVERMRAKHEELEG